MTIKRYEISNYELTNREFIKSLEENYGLSHLHGHISSSEEILLYDINDTAVCFDFYWTGIGKDRGYIGLSIIGDNKIEGTKSKLEDELNIKLEETVTEQVVLV